LIACHVNRRNRSAGNLKSSEDNFLGRLRVPSADFVSECAQLIADLDLFELAGLASLYLE
jgi:hypothetical protein